MFLTRILVRMKRANMMKFQGVLVLALLALSLLACTNLAEQQPMADTGAAEVTLAVERFTAPQAEMDHFVAAIDEELFIGVAVAAQDADYEEPRTVTVYLCDSQMVSAWISGEIAGQEGELTAGDASADVTITEDGVSGTVALDGGEPRPFTAEPATDNAGIYRAELSQGGADFRIDWVVLNDGRQRGPLDGKGNDVIIVDPN